MNTWTTKNDDSHIILYAKHHYQEGNVIDDLKKIYSVRNATNIEHINSRDILNCLLILVERLIKTPELEINFSLIDFISDIDPDSYWNYNLDKKEYNFVEVCIKKCLSIISLIRVYKDDIEIFPLDEPNENILPLKKT